MRIPLILVHRLRAVSLILCHDKPKSRTRQVEKLAEVASRLRMLNNYSSLRAIITAINQSTFPGDTVMESFRMKTDLYKKYLSSDVLLRTTGTVFNMMLVLYADVSVPLQARTSHIGWLFETRKALVFHLCMSLSSFTSSTSDSSPV